MNKVSAPPKLPSAATVPCPRCKEPLIDPKGLGWCKACGYCASLAETEAKAVAAPATPQKPGALDELGATGMAIGQLPMWVWVLLVGLIAVVGATYALGHYLTLTPLNRALLATIQIGAGIMLMFVGQFIGLLKVAPDDPTLSFKDAIFPFRLYGFVMKRLPSTQLTLYFGMWGLAAAISAGIFIGGMSHWLTYLPDSKKGPNQTQKKAAR